MRTDMLANIDPEALLAAIVGSTNDAIIITDPEGTIRFWNRSTEIMLGFSEAEALGRHISFLVPLEQADEETALIAKVMADQFAQVETKRRRRDGTMAEIILSACLIRGKDGAVAGIARVAREITALRAAERQAAYLAAIVGSSDDAIISKNFDGIITSWNKAAERIFGYSAAEAVGKPITIIIPPERISEERSIIETLRAGGRIEHFETVRRHRNGNDLDISLSISPIIDMQGHLIGASKIARDITERKRTERKLVELSRRKDEFLANMSHELRTPMNAIVGLTDLLAMSQPLTDRQRKFIDTLKTSSDNLLALINDLLDFSKVEQGELRLEQIEFSLPDVVTQAISPLAVKAEQKGINLRVNYLNALREHYIGDPLRLQQVVTNLVSNAVKFTERGSIDVSLSAAASAIADMTMLVIEVTDTGIGIPDTAVGSIFEKFYQAEAAITRKYGGTGLGLSIVRAIVLRMGGTIEVESQVSVGTTFTVRIPLRHGRDAKMIKPPQAHPAPGPDGIRRVLVVEDYEPNALVVAAMLDAGGYSYEIAASGREAISMFQRSGFNAILMDVQMPGLDGFETTRRIRALEQERGLPHTPIIAVTAHVMERDRDDCIRAGMDDFIAKPYTLDVLNTKLGQYSSKH